MGRERTSPGPPARRSSWIERPEARPTVSARDADAGAWLALVQPIVDQPARQPSAAAPLGAATSPSCRRAPSSASSSRLRAAAATIPDLRDRRRCSSAAGRCRAGRPHAHRTAPVGQDSPPRPRQLELPLRRAGRRRPQRLPANCSAIAPETRCPRQQPLGRSATVRLVGRAGRAPRSRSALEARRTRDSAGQPPATAAG